MNTLEVLWNSKLVRWDATAKQFALVVDHKPAFCTHVSEGFAAAHPERYLTASALALTFDAEPSRLAMAAMGAALQPLAAISELYSEQEDATFEIWIDSHLKETRVTLGQCRAAREALALLLPAKQPTGDVDGVKNPDRTYEDPCLPALFERRPRFHDSAMQATSVTGAVRNCDVEDAARAIESTGNGELAGRLRRTWKAERSAAHVDLGLAEIALDQLKARLSSADALIAAFQAEQNASDGPRSALGEDHAAFERAFEIITGHKPQRSDDGEYEAQSERDAWVRWQQRKAETESTGAQAHA